MSNSHWLTPVKFHVEIKNTILNIMGLWGNFGTRALIVVNTLGTHWEHIGNTNCPYNTCEPLFDFIEREMKLSYNMGNAPTMSFNHTRSMLRDA